MKNISKILLSFFLLASAGSYAQASLAVVSSVTAQNGEGGYGSAIIDTADSFVAFGSSNPVVVGVSTVGYISKYGISPAFTYVSAISNFSNITNLNVAAFDRTTGFSYWVSSGSPSILQKIHLAAPITFSSMTFAAGINQVGTAVIDPVNQIGYFGTATSTSVVVKIDLSNLTMISSMTLPGELGFLSASVIDPSLHFAYFASSTTPGAIAKIKLSDFTLAGTLSLNSGDGPIASAVIDETGQFGYFGTHDSPGKVIKVNLNSLSRTNSLTLKSGEDDLTSAVIDTTRHIAYFGTNTSSGIVVPIYLTTLVEKTAVQLGAGQDFLRSAAIDETNGYAYFGTYTSTGVVIKMDLLAGAPDFLAQPSNASIHAGDIFVFSVIADGRSLTYQWQMNGVNIAGATAATYSRASTSADDQAVFHCVVTGSGGTVISNDATITIIPEVRAYPNPWRSDRHTGVNITFDGLLPNTTVKIFNLAARWVKTLPAGTNTWDLTNDAGQPVASGYYIYLATTGNDDQASHGKIAVIH